MKHTILLAALLAAGCNNKPSGFGIDVEARTSMLPAATRNSIVSARLLVSGAETFQKDIPGVGKAAQSGAFKFRYVPAVRSGTIVIRVDGLDGSGATVAGGTAPPVNLADGKAVDALLTLAINGNGVTCMAATDCISANCVDGVCCDTSCDGACESCNQPGLVGECAPAMTGTDPDNDCLAKIATDDGGVSDDGGTSGTVGGDNPTACAGTCDGHRACAFPGGTVSCGANVCSAAATVAGFFCDGNGGCSVQNNQCTDYNCSGGACRINCTQDSDCQAPDFCNLNINKCVPKHVDGIPCAMGDECKTGFCYSGVCCNTTCGDATQSCNNAGNVGKCQCINHGCPSGIACQLFYKDSDLDTFGDKNGTLTNGKAVAGCVGDAAPSGFTADNTDCDDGDANAHPGQTTFFGTPSIGAGTFDYNCDGALEKGTIEEIGVACGFCTGIPICGKNATCGSAGTASYFNCGGAKFCGFSVQSAFTVAVPCGQNGAFVTCGACVIAGGGPTSSSVSRQQTCH